MDIIGMVGAFFGDARVKTLIGLIFIDVILGVACAIRAKQFEWRKLADWYRTMVVPYVLGFLAFYLGAKIITLELLGDFGHVASEAAISMAWATLIGTLASKIIENAKALGYPMKPAG